MATFFLGGAAGSALAAWTYARWGWTATAVLGMALPGAALAYFATERGERH
jgi:predicted MFS family arabinose efflux permease